MLEVTNYEFIFSTYFTIIQAPAIVPDNRPPDGWPTHGHVKFDHYSTRYREGLDLVIRDIQAEVPGGTKVCRSCLMIMLKDPCHPYILSVLPYLMIISSLNFLVGTFEKIITNYVRGFGSSKNHLQANGKNKAYTRYNCT